MNYHPLRISLISLAAALLTVSCVALLGNSAAAQTARNTELATGTAQLLNKVDMKTARQGEKVTAKLTSKIHDAGAAGTLVLPKGTLLVGEVANVKAHSKGAPSSLSLTFNEAQFKNGKTVPVKVVLIGAYPPAGGGDQADSYLGGDMPEEVSESQAFNQAPGALNHVAMHSSAQSTISAIFTSRNHNIDLAKGTRFQIAIRTATKG